MRWHRHEKDLGPKTIEFKATERFNPDKSWMPVSDTHDWKLLNQLEPCDVALHRVFGLYWHDSPDEEIVNPCVRHI